MFENGRKTIGMFACKVPEYFQRTVCKAMAEQAEQWDYNLVIFSTFGEYESNREYINGECNMLAIPCYEKLDAIVLLLDTFDIPEMVDMLLSQLKERVSCPIISIRKKQEGCISILSDDKEAVSRMVNHMIDCHQAKKIYYLSGLSSMNDIARREEGFRETMEKRGMDFRESYIYSGTLWYDVGKRAVDYFLGLSEELPDAILCANDYMAISVCEELNKRNIDVPGDICVTGFDDVVEARQLFPQISTVSVRPEDFAKKAMEIIRMSARGEVLKEEYYIHSNNQYRDSCGCGQSGKELVAMFRQLAENNRRLIHLGKQNTFMVFRMERINQYGELPDLIGKFVEGNEGVHDFFISLNENEEYESAKNTGNPFTERMTLSIHAHFNKRHIIEVDIPKTTFAQTKLLPPEFQEDRPLIYYVNPMHYREHCFGYAMISFDDHQFQECGDFYQPFLVNLSGVLENIWVQKHIEKLNQEKLHLLRYERDTDILNQYGFFEMASVWMREAYEKRSSLAFECINIANLQEIMDIYGWAERDDAILAVVSAMRKVLEGQWECMIGRTGENEFGIVFRNVSKEMLKVISEKLSAAVNYMNLEWDRDYFVEFCCGGVVQNINGLFGVEECMRRARLKMNRNFSARKNSTKYINEAVQYICHNYYRNLTVQEIADNIGITRAYLSTCFKSVYSFSVQEYLTEYRMKKAKEMLQDSDLQIKEIAYYTGYQDELYFSKVFKKRFGISPREFRQQSM